MVKHTICHPHLPSAVPLPAFPQGPPARFHVASSCNSPRPHLAHRGLWLHWDREELCGPVVCGEQTGCWRSYRIDCAIGSTFGSQTSLFHQRSRMGIHVFHVKPIQSKFFLSSVKQGPIKQCQTVRPFRKSQIVQRVQSCPVCTHWSNCRGAGIYSRR